MSRFISKICSQILRHSSRLHRFWIKASSLSLGCNCDPVNDPSENTFPFDIYRLSGLTGGKGEEGDVSLSFSLS